MNPPQLPLDRPTFERDLAELEARFEDLEPEFELVVRDPALGLKGYVVVWSTLNAIGGPLGRCGKGGTRITPSLSLEEVRMLPQLATYTDQERLEGVYPQFAALLDEDEVEEWWAAVDSATAANTAFISQPMHSAVGTKR